jgi:hypothetical protein
MTYYELPSTPNKYKRYESSKEEEELYAYNSARCWLFDMSSDQRKKIVKEIEDYERMQVSAEMSKL